MAFTLDQLHRKLIVSCQAYPGDPMEDITTLTRVAQSALLGGAAGLRVNSAEHVRMLRTVTASPIIAIEKSYAGGALRITPDFAAAAALTAAGASIIALDCTDRTHAAGEPWREIVRRIQSELGVFVMADIATLREGINAAAAGVDLIGTTLNGYTAETANNHAFDPELVAALARETGKPIVAEGHISTPEQALIALNSGAHCVVVGSAITRPGEITKNYIQVLEQRTRAADTRYVIGVDIGGTTVKAALVNTVGETSHHVRVPTQASGGRDLILASTLNAIDQVHAASQSAGIAPIAIGVASAGAIDATNGTVFAATENLPGWAGFDLASAIRAHITLPVFVENDAHAAALAELHFGVARGLKTFAAITLGTGVGGGLVINGHLHRGAFGFAGTIGHMVIRVNGVPCNCGRNGCLESYVSTAALVREYTAQPTAAHLPGNDDAARATQIATLARENDPAAKAAYAALAGYLAEGIANIFNIVDPECVILSGGLIDNQPGFLEDVQSRTQSLLHFGNKRPPRLLAAASSQYAGVQGAAAAAFEKIQ